MPQGIVPANVCNQFKNKRCRPQKSSELSFNLHHHTMQKIAFRYGLWMFIGFTGFFLLMHAIGLSEESYLRIFNGVIHLGFLWAALREWSQNHHGEANEYTSGVVAGIYTSLVGIIPFTVFMAIFLSYNPGLMAAIQQQSPIGEYFNPVTSSLFIFVEGLAISLIASYIIIRILESMHQGVSR